MGDKAQYTAEQVAQYTALYAEAEVRALGLQQYKLLPFLNTHSKNQLMREMALDLRRVLGNIEREIPKEVRDKMSFMGNLELLATNTILQTED